LANSGCEISHLAKPQDSPWEITSHTNPSAATTRHT
jgi:hypothetical protein